MATTPIPTPASNGGTTDTAAAPATQPDDPNEGQFVDVWSSDSGPITITWPDPINLSTDQFTALSAWMDSIKAKIGAEAKVAMTAAAPAAH